MFTTADIQAIHNIAIALGQVANILGIILALKVISLVISGRS